MLDSPPGDVALAVVVPQSVELRTGLSGVVQQALPQMVAAAVTELTRLGLAPTPLPRPAPPHVWWEQGQGAVPC